jgi:hypothetical protein
MTDMSDQRSDTQFGFKVDLDRPRSKLRGVALLGHQTLTDLHEAISAGSHGGTDSSFSFRFREAHIEQNTRLDKLNLDIGETLEYFTDSLNGKRHQVITVDFIENE